MAQIKKLGLPTKERKALLRNQASYLLWHGKLETTTVKAKSVASYTEKVLTDGISDDEYTTFFKVVDKIRNNIERI